MAKKAAASTDGQPKRRGRQRERQTAIPGTEETEIPDLQDAAESYVEIRDERCALSKKESEAHDQLLATMKQHKRLNYRLPDGSVATLKPGKEKVHVVKPDDQKPDDLQPVDGGAGE